MVNIKYAERYFLLPEIVIVLMLILLSKYGYESCQIDCRTEWTLTAVNDSDTIAGPLWVTDED